MRKTHNGNSILYISLITFLIACSNNPDDLPELASKNEWQLTIGEEVINGTFTYDETSDHALISSPEGGPYVSNRSFDGFFKLAFKNNGLEFAFQTTDVENPNLSPLNFEGFPNTTSSAFAWVKYTEPGTLDDKGSGTIYQSNPINVTGESFTLNIESYEKTYNDFTNNELTWYYLDGVKLVYTSEVGATTDYVDGLPVSNTDRILLVRFEVDFDNTILFPEID